MGQIQTFSSDIEVSHKTSHKTLHKGKCGMRTASLAPKPTPIVSIHTQWQKSKRRKSLASGRGETSAVVVQSRSDASQGHHEAPLPTENHPVVLRLSFYHVHELCWRPRMWRWVMDDMSQTTAMKCLEPKHHFFCHSLTGIGL